MQQLLRIRIARQAGFDRGALRLGELAVEVGAQQLVVEFVL